MMKSPRLALAVTRVWTGRAVGNNTWINITDAVFSQDRA
jgi:hypothetical protein